MGNHQDRGRAISLLPGDFRLHVPADNYLFYRSGLGPRRASNPPRVGRGCPEGRRPDTFLGFMTPAEIASSAGINLGR